MRIAPKKNQIPLSSQGISLDNFGVFSHYYTENKFTQKMNEFTPYVIRACVFQNKKRTVFLYYST